MEPNRTFIRLYALQSKDTGEQSSPKGGATKLLWGHAMPMQAAVKAQQNAKRLGYDCGIVRVQ